MISNENSESEVDIYLKEGIISQLEDPLTKQQLNSLKFPLLSKFAKKIFSKMPTSIEVERIDSEEGNILANKRHSLHREMLQTLVVARNNTKNNNNNNSLS